MTSLQNSIDIELMKKLIHFRVSGNKSALLSSFDLEDTSNIKKLEEAVSHKVNQWNHENSTESELRKIREKNASIVDSLSEQTKLLQLYDLTAQLVQYYTFLCRMKSTEQVSLSQVEEFIATHKRTIGEIDHNLFMLEYKLITIFNEFGSLCENVKDETYKVENLAERVAMLSKRVSEIKA